MRLPMRIGAGPVPVKDCYQNNADEKNINSYWGEHDENTASASTLQRVNQEKPNFL